MFLLFLFRLVTKSAIGFPLLVPDLVLEQALSSLFSTVESLCGSTGSSLDDVDSSTFGGVAFPSSFRRRVSMASIR